MADDEVRIPPAGRVFDLATVVGLIGAISLIATAIVLGGTPTAFINFQSFLIVVGGTVCITTMCHSISEKLITCRICGRTFFTSMRAPKDAAVQVLQISYMARRNGVLSLQGSLDNMKPEPFLF